MTEHEVRDKTIEEVRAFMAERFLYDYDITDGGGCGTCGYGGEGGMSMGAISQVLDRLKSKKPVWEKSENA